MIISMLITPFLVISTFIIDILPNSVFEGVDVSGFVNMFNVAFQFFPSDVWFFCISTITFWVTVHLVFGFINFVVKLFLGGITL